MPNSTTMANPSRWVESSWRPNVVADPVKKRINGWYYLGLYAWLRYHSLIRHEHSSSMRALGSWDEIPYMFPRHWESTPMQISTPINTLRRTLTQHPMLLLTCSRPIVSHAIPIKLIFWAWNVGRSQGGSTPYSTDTDVKGGRGHGRL